MFDVDRHALPEQGNVKYFTTKNCVACQASFFASSPIVISFEFISLRRPSPKLLTVSRWMDIVKPADDKKRIRYDAINKTKKRFLISSSDFCLVLAAMSQLSLHIT